MKRRTAIAIYQIPVSLLEICAGRSHRDAAAIIALYCSARMAQHIWAKHLQAAATFNGSTLEEAERNVREYGRGLVTYSRKFDVPDLVYADSPEECHRSIITAMGWGELSDDLLAEYRTGIAADGAIPHAPFASIGESIVGDLLSGAWSPSLFAVYVAIVSMIGTRRVPSSLRYAELQRRSDGFTKMSVLSVPDYSPSLTIGSLRRRIADLERRGMIRTYSPSHTRERLYWLPSKVSDATAREYIINRGVAKAGRQGFTHTEIELAIEERLAAGQRHESGTRAARERHESGTRAARERQLKTSPSSIPFQHPLKASPSSIPFQHPLPASTPTASPGATLSPLGEEYLWDDEDLF